jgi:hypothetical protein
MSDVILDNDRKTLQLKALKIVTALIYGLVTLFSLIFFISVATGDDGTDLAYAILLIILLGYGSIFFGISLIISLIGLIITIVKRKDYEVKSTLKFFIVFTALPILTYLLIGAVILILIAI